MKSHCPYCDYVAEVVNPDAKVEERELIRLEVDHMNAKHPDIIKQRLINAGELPGERKPI